MRKGAFPVTRKEECVPIDFRRKNLAVSSVSTYTTSVKGYYRFIKENGLSEGIDSIARWLRSQENPNSFNKNYQAIKEYLLKRFEDESAEHRLELQEALANIKRKKPQKAVTITDFLTKNEVELFVKKIPHDLGVIISALFWTGCRVSELLSIRLADCMESDVVSITIRNRKSGCEDLDVYISRNLFKEIREVFKGRKLLFEDESHRAFSRQALTMRIKRAGRKFLNREIGAHTFRHSKAMYLKNERCLSPDQVAAALGHSNVLTTLKYYFHGKPTPKDQGIIEL